MSYAVNRIINVEDFSEPLVRDTIREVFAAEAAADPTFPTGREHRKLWEVAMAVIALRQGGAIRPDAEILGIGAGTEATLFWLTNHVRRVWATDRYADAGIWDQTAQTNMFTDPGYAWNGPWNPRRLVVQHVDATNLTYEDETFDGIFSSGSIEHFGSLANIRTAMAEAYRVLKPGGTCSISTEYLLSGDPLAYEELTVMFTAQLLHEVVVDGLGWELVTPLDASVSTLTYATEIPIERFIAKQERVFAETGRDIKPTDFDPEDYPHAVLRIGDNRLTSVHIALRKPAPGIDDAPAPIVVDTPPGQVAPSAPQPGTFALAAALPDPTVVIDGGCRWGFSEAWTMLGDDVRLVGFDPDEEECRRLEEQYAGQEGREIVPVALGSEPGTLPYRKFAFGGGNSLHPHDERAMAHVAIPRDGDALEELVDVPILTLDDWTAEHRVARVDVVKLDVQGHELDILRGAEEVLRRTRAVELEVCFNPIMDGTPLFGEVDAFMRERGFMLWRLREPAFYPTRDADGAAGTLEVAVHYGFPAVTWVAPPGFLSWANAIYVRQDIVDPEADLSWTVRVRDAVLANQLLLHDIALVSLRRALLASPPANVIPLIEQAIAGALEAAAAAPPAPVPEPAPAPPAASGAPQPQPGAEAASAATQATGPRSARTGGLAGKAQSLAKRAWAPAVWRLNRNDQHAQQHADAIRRQLETVQAELAARLDQLAHPPAVPAAAPPDEDELGRLRAEVMRLEAVTRGAIVEWTALLARIADDAGTAPDDRR
jgi:FkbM family methyltransferase